MSTRTARLDRKLVIVAEAERSGSNVVRVMEDEGSWSAFLFRNGEARHVYAEGYLSSAGTLIGLRTTPGEHHTILPCSISAPAGFVVDRKAWWCHDPRLAWMLQSLEPSLHIAEQSWRWHEVRGGRTYYDAEWCARVAPCAKGTHLVVRGLEPGPFDTINLCGIAYFHRVAWAIQSVLAGVPAGPPMLVDTVYDEIAADLFDRAELWIHEPVNSAEEIGPRIAALLQPTKTISTGAALDAKRMEFARKVLPQNATHLPVLAVIGDSFLGSYEALVVTPTHGFVRRKTEARTSFAWSEVLDVIVAEDTECWLQTERLGWVPVPGCFEPAAVASALSQAVR